MPQLPITPAVSPQVSAGSSQASSAVALVAEVGSGLEGVQGLDFGAVLTKQLKDIAALLEQKEGAGLSSVTLKEIAEPVANAGVEVLPVDLSALTASMLMPAIPAQMGSGARISAESGAEEPMIHLPRVDKAPLTAEIAANGKSLPQAISSEQSFADRLVAMVNIPAENVGGELHSADLSAMASPSPMVAAFRNPEPLPALPVAPRVGSAEWGGAVGEKVVWMASQNHQVAELHLNPPNLGPLEVRLTISNDQASALFVSHHSAVREAIEAAMPRLREMLADNGIMLGNVTVGSESFSQQQAFDQRNGKEGNRGGLGAEDVMALRTAPGQPSGRVRDGMVDIFA